MLKKNFIVIGMLFSMSFSISCYGQSSDSLMVQLSRKWINAKAYALKIAGSMPESDYNFKPVPEEMSFKQQLLHLADNIRWLSSSYLFVSGPNPQIDTAHLTKAAVIKIVSDAYDEGLKAHHKITPPQLDEIVKFFAGPMTRRQILLLMHDHQSHHLGQLIVYLRLKGVSPPDYVGW